MIIETINAQERVSFWAALALEKYTQQLQGRILFNFWKVAPYSFLFDEANDFSQVYRLDESVSKILLRRAAVHYELEEFEDTGFDCETALKLAPSLEAENLLLNARRRIMNQIPNSPLEILNIPFRASNEKVKKVYRKLMLTIHPDKHPDATKLDKKKMERKFNTATAAYRTLREDPTPSCRSWKFQIDQ